MTHVKSLASKGRDINFLSQFLDDCQSADNDELWSDVLIYGTFLMGSE